MTTEPGAAKTRKGEQTRALILRTALDLFTARGYEETTMRAIAEQAGVSVGNAYYYFRSKEQLIQAFYERIHEDHLAASRPILDRERGLKARLHGVLKAQLDVSAPYHRFSAVLFKTAADPKSPLSPFGPESNPVRRESTALYAEVLTGSKTKVPDELMAELPNLIWIYQMGIILFWIHDESPNRARSYRLAERTVDIISRLIKLASHPFLRPFRKTTLQLLAELRQDVDKAAPGPGGEPAGQGTTHGASASGGWRGV